MCVGGGRVGRHWRDLTPPPPGAQERHKLPTLSPALITEAGCAFEAGEAQGQEDVGGWEPVWGGLLPAWEPQGCIQFSADSSLLLNIIMFIVLLNPVDMGVHFRKLTKHR